MFKVLASGKLLAGSKATAIPGKGEGKDETVKTDEDGLTIRFADKGRYCVAARHLDEEAVS